MTQRNPHREVWRLAAPMILAGLSVPLLGAVDTAVMGHLPDPRFLGAVAVGAMVAHFLFWAFGFLRMATTGLAAQAGGTGDPLEVRAVLARGLLAAGAVALLVLTVQTLIADLAFPLVGASAAVTAEARVYFEIRVWAAPATLANYVIWGWLLGLQNARGPLFLTLAVNSLNLVLDLVLVWGLGMTASGVALATVVAESCGLLLAVPMLRRELCRHPGNWDWPRILRREALLRLLRINGDIFVRTLALLFAFAFFTSQGARFGDAVLAANAVLLNFQTFMAYGLDGFAHAAEALVGRAVGKGRRDELLRMIRVTGIWSLGTALVFTASYLLFGGLIIDLLTGIDEIRGLAREYLVLVALSPLVSVWAFWMDGVFLGATRSSALRNGMLVSVALYLLAWYLLQPWGNTGLWLALLLFLLLRGVTLAVQLPGVLKLATQQTNR